MSMYKNFQTNESLETKGIVLDYGDFRITTARAGGKNKRFAKTLETLSKPYRRAIQTEMLPQERGMELLRTAYAQAVVLNWETLVDGEFVQGIEGPDGKLLEFNSQNVETTFKNLPDLFTDVQEQATKAALYRDSVIQDEAGN